MRIPRMSCPAVLSVLCVCVLGAPATALAAEPPEAPVTEAATAVTGTAATFNGTLNPKAKATAGWYFAYNTGGSCTGGATTPAEPEAEVKAQKELFHVTGLAPSTTYAVCLVATVESEEGQLATVGSQVTLKTGRAVPAIDAESLGAVTPFEATIEAAINPDREDTICSVEYGTSKAYGTIAACEPSDLGGGFGDQATVAHLTGLEAAHTYFYRVVAVNATGTSKGSGGEFATLAAEAPLIESETVSQVTPEEAIVEAQIDPNFQETTFHFEYSPNSEFNEPVTVGGGSLAGSAGQLTGSVVLGTALTSGQRYFYRVVAENATGPTVGETKEFTTVGLPDVQTGAAQGIGRTTAALSGSINPAGATTSHQVPETSYRFLYIAQPTYEAAVASGAANPYAGGASSSLFIMPPEGTGELVGFIPAGPVPVRELTAGTTYHYALVATNEAGTAIGPDMTFTTAPATPPTVATGGAEQITQTSAQLTGTLDTRGLQTTYRFETGSEAGHYTPLAAVVIGAGAAGSESVAAQLAYLAPGGTYHYRLCATNQDGTECGGDQVLVTPTYAALTPTEATPFPLLTGIVPQAAPPPPKPGSTLTRVQKLAKALRACRAKARAKRAKCERQARQKYGPVGHKKKK